MPVTQPISLKDFFNKLGTQLANTPAPGSGSSLVSKPVATPPAPAPVASAPGYLSPTNPIFNKPTTPPPPPPPGPDKSDKRVFTATPPPAPTAPTTTNLDYSKYINPQTGKPYTPQEYAESQAAKLGKGTVTTYAGEAIDDPNMSEDELTKKARVINNERNDIAVGETDPTDSASNSGIQYTPAELSAIEKAKAGEYTPALNDVFTKLKNKQDADAQAATDKAAQDKSDRDLQNDLLKMGVQFKYNLALQNAKSAGDGPDLSGLTLDDYATTTSKGNKFIDLSTVTDKVEKKAVENAARASGVPVLTDTNVQKINAIEDTRNNLDNIEGQFANIGYKSGATKALGGFGLSNRIADLFGSTNVGSFKAWRTAAINSIQALAGGVGSGLRINQAEINAAMNNDIPNEGDTIAVGSAKLAVLKKQLDSWENTLLQSDTNKNVNKGNVPPLVAAPAGSADNDPLGIR